MNIKIELPVEDWNYILEVLSQHQSVEIKKRAIELIKNGSESTEKIEE